MSKFAKLGLVFSGVMLACLTAVAVVYIWQLFSQGSAAQASSGMYAFGDLFLFLGVFGVMMLLPAGMALYSSCFNGSGGAHKKIVSSYRKLYTSVE